MSCKPGAYNLDVDIQGHRGCAGLMPENSIAGFIHALELGVRTIELDVVMNSDGELVVSHEPWISSEYCSGPGGKRIQGRPSIYRMDQAEVEQYDCGSGHHPRFPDQKKMYTVKPTLKSVVEAVIADGPCDADQVTWNIEIKLQDEWIGTFCPERDDYLDRFYQEAHVLGIANNSILQCFDAQLLRMAHARKEIIPLSYLVYNKKDICQNLDELGFVPEFYSPAFQVVSSGTIEEAHGKGIRVLVWTVDEEVDMLKMMRIGVDGIITNYPDRLNRLLIKLREENPRNEK